MIRDDYAGCGGWRDQAACKATDTAVFFTRRRDGEAEALCAGCPVRGDCRAAGRYEHGWWGGVGVTESKARKRADDTVALQRRQRRQRQAS